MSGRICRMVGLSIAALFLTMNALAEAGQVVEDTSVVGVRFTIPTDWQWKTRDRDIFVNCAPTIQSRPGMPGCYLIVRKVSIVQGQTAITDANRAEWTSWTTASGLRQLVSTRDLEVGRSPSYEVVVKHGRKPDDPLGHRVFVLIPGFGVIDAMLYAYWNDQDQSARFNAAFHTALGSLRPAN